MLIANPIYDVVFKRMMENERVAKFFVGTMLNQTVSSITVKPQEFTYTNELAGIAVFRLDFVAIIKTEEGEDKKILIEIQKAKNEVDLMRFWNYLAEQYKKEENVEGEKVALPITTIYILGFKLYNIESACIHVERQYRDMIEDRVIGERNEFIEKLTHDSYVVQVKRITNRYQSRLDKLLSVFEQDHFIGDTEVIKEFLHETDVDEVKLITDILHHTGTDSDTRKQIEIEQEAWRSIQALTSRKEKAYAQALKELEEKDRIIEELRNNLKNQ